MLVHLKPYFSAIVFAGCQRAETPAKGTDGDGLINANTVSAHASASLQPDLYDARRRSLRQLGLQPVEPGFPYYSPARPRSSGKHSSKLRDEECSVSSRSSSKADDPVRDGGRRERAESSMSVDESSNASFQQSAQKSLSQNGSLSSNGSQDPFPSRLTNTNVRRQIIRPWEDKLLASMDEQLSGCSKLPTSPTAEQTIGNHFGSESRILFNLAPSSVMSQGANSAAEVLACVVTPNNQLQSSVRQDDSHVSETRAEVSEMLNGQLRNVGSSTMSSMPLKNCSVMVDRDIGRACEQKSPQPNKVVIDCGGLVELYERVVKDTEQCSVEKMEQLHATFEQLVFRHRMCWEREALLMVSMFIGRMTVV